MTTPALGAPLTGVRVLEIASIGPGPHAAMMLADLGADVVRISRPLPSNAAPEQRTHVLRHRVHATADLKNAEDVAHVRALVAQADVLIEGFRPGVMERLGLGPEECLEMNPRLVYGRMTGWGQDGPLRQAAGHDINYIALTGALNAIGPADQPVPPLNLVGDYGAGSSQLVIGVLAALHSRQTTGQGQVVDAAMVDGISVLLQPILELRADGSWQDERASNLLDGGAPFYRTYACADERHMAVGAIEPQFYALLLAGLGLDAGKLPAQHDKPRWPELEAALAQVFSSRDQRHWVTVFEGTDACVTPVLTFEEASAHSHVAARKSLVARAGVIHAGTAPRFSRQGTTPLSQTRPFPEDLQRAEVGEVRRRWEDLIPTERP